MLHTWNVYWNDANVHGGSRWKGRNEMKLSNKTYDTLKWVALVVIPASATLVLTVGKIWGLPYYDNIGATISAIGLFIAAIIGVSSKDFYEVEPMDVEELNYIEDGEENEQN